MPPLRFTDRRSITSVADLPDPAEQAQVRAAGKLYDGLDLPIEDRLAEGGPDAREGSFAGYCELYKIMDGDQHVYDAYFIMVDSGAFFRAGTTADVAQIIQFGLECEDPALRALLEEAMSEAKVPPLGGS